MRKLAESVSSFISRENLLSPGDRIGLAVSGGADSVALFRVMIELRDELGILISILHFNHKLRGADSEVDEEFVRGLSRQYGLEFFCASGNAAQHAEDKHLSLEAAGRFLRYEFFLTVLRDARLNRIATAHTLDDQAETVLLKLARGAGTRGLAAIYPKLAVEPSSADEIYGHPEKFIIRPLLNVRRRVIELYLVGLGQAWREDRSNRDLRHSRNVVRHGILPRLERNLNPAVREVLAETAEIARAEEEYWKAKITELMSVVLKPDESPVPGATLDRRILSAQPKATQRRLIRSLAESLGFNLEFKHVERILQLTLDSKSPQSVMLPRGWKASRIADGLGIQRTRTPPIPDYEYNLPVPGRIIVPEAERWIEALLVRPTAESAYNPDHAIDPSLLREELQVRNWRPGDRFWPDHTKSPKKIKELLQERHVTGVDRKRVPIVVSGTDVIWVEGFPVPAALRPQGITREAVIIRTGIAAGNGERPPD
ncbi:MAG: tRNA lysidine(34) synthetase TilS [Terriglobales bacterium]